MDHTVVPTFWFGLVDFHRTDYGWARYDRKRTVTLSVATLVWLRFIARACPTTTAP